MSRPACTRSSRNDGLDPGSSFWSGGRESQSRACRSCATRSRALGNDVAYG